MSNITFMRWRVGGVTVTRIVEMHDTPLDVAWIFPEATIEMVEKHREWIAPEYVDDQGRILFARQGFIVDTGTRRVMVDTCVGNNRKRFHAIFSDLNTPFLEHLTAAGYPPETIDTVLCTHLHVDHCGWNTRLEEGRWVPTFPNARYLLARMEFEYWQNEDKDVANAGVYDDAVRPVLEAGLIDLVDTSHRVCEEIWLEPSPGHTPGHCSVRISSMEQDAVITGDMIHHPLQMGEPDLCSGFCYDNAQAKVTRRRFLERYCDGRTVVLGSHFPGPVGGLIRKLEPAEWWFEAFKPQ